MIKIQDFINTEVCPAFKASFNNVIKHDYEANMTDTYDIDTLRAILNDLMVETPNKQAF
jgi:hypothetical protein